MSPNFWQAFEKRADSGAGNAAGGGFTGAGKGNLGTAERDHINGTARSNDLTDKTLLDRDRTCRTEDPFSTGPELQDETNPHIRY